MICPVLEKQTDGLQILEVYGSFHRCRLDFFVSVPKPCIDIDSSLDEHLDKREISPFYRRYEKPLRKSFDTIKSLIEESSKCQEVSFGLTKFNNV
jgi:hypothetical protein